MVDDMDDELKIGDKFIKPSGISTDLQVYEIVGKTTNMVVLKSNKTGVSEMASYSQLRTTYFRTQ